MLKSGKLHIIRLTIKGELSKIFVGLKTNQYLRFKSLEIN